MELVSIVIPVYNSELYLEKCLDSITGQTHENLEILCIDDGSYDRSVDLCNDYALRDNRIRVFCKESPGGSGSPCNSQNIGLKNFTGQYVGFSDPDDWMEPDMVATLYSAIKKYNASISVVSFYKNTNNIAVAMENKKIIPEDILSARDMIYFTFERELYRGFEFPTWNKLYSASLLKENKNLFFDKRLKLAYDTLFNITAYLTPGCTGVYTDKPLYHWCQHDTSLFNSATPEMWMDTFNVLKQINNMLNDNGYGDLSILVKRLHCFWASLQVEEAFKSGDKSKLQLMQEEMRVYFEEYAVVNSEYPDRVERAIKLEKVCL